MNYMNYQQLRDYALQCSLEHHLCNVTELMQEGKTPDEILAMVEEGNDTIVVYEPYDWCSEEELVDEIESARGVNVYNFLFVLRQVNSQEWLTKFKGGEAQS